MTMISIKPSEILFCQENIDGKFGRGSNISLLDTFKKLVSGEMTPSDLPKITVVSYEGKYYVYDGHRRLFLFKVCKLMFLRYSLCLSINVNVNEWKPAERC